MKRMILFLLVWMMSLVACANAVSPAETVETYLQAKVDGDAETVRSLLCADMEADLEREANTFASVSGVHLEGMVCEQVADSTTVACQGKIVALYGTEETEFPLVSYRVVDEDGEWKWCGETGE